MDRSDSKRSKINGNEETSGEYIMADSARTWDIPGLRLGHGGVDNDYRTINERDEKINRRKVYFNSTYSMYAKQAVSREERPIDSLFKRLRELTDE